MKTKCKRLLSLLLVFVLVLGLIPAVYAATDAGTQPTTEPAATKVTETAPIGDVDESILETQVEEPGELEQTDTSSAQQPISEDEVLWATLSAQLPNPIEGYSPLDPDNPYPYGEPVDNFYPSWLLEADPYAIAPMADMDLIPDEMYDNMILRALEYTGFDVQWLKDRGYLYVADYISSNLKNNAPSVLSDIGYWESGACPNGDETVADPSTVTGKAPKISYFESNGLVCASFVTYYLCNYLPNIEGVDTSVIYNKAKELGADSRYDNVYYLTSVSLWKNTLDSLASQTGSGVTKYTNSTTAYANLVPGDVIIFSRDGSLTHAAIYAGTYDLYNASGTNRGKYHFIIHVGNSRGPEISTVEYMANAGSKSSSPSAWYHLDVNDIVDETGFIEVYKKDPDGNNLSGAKFKAVNQDTNETFYIGPTDANGYAKSGELPFGTYVITETVFPTGYNASGTTTWTKTIDKNTPNNTITINAVNKKITGGFTIQKATNTGSDLNGWVFGVYTDSACTKPISGSPFTTPASGKITITGLTPGTYYVKETSQNINYWITDNTVKTVKVTDGSNDTVYVTNTNYGYGKIIKKTNTGASLSGWKFNVYTDSGLTQKVSGSPFSTATDGTIVMELLPGTYYVQEVDESAKYPDWSFDTTVRTLKVEANTTKSVTFTNNQSGYAEIVKETNTGKDLGGWKFDIFTDPNCTQRVTGSPFTTDDAGKMSVRLLPGTYYVQEIDESNIHPDWVYDDAVHIVIVEAGQTASVKIENQQMGRVKLIKAMPDGGPVSGWVFDIYRKSDDAYMGTFTSGEDGNILSDWFLPGEYLVYEQLDDQSVYWCESKNPQEVTIEAGKTAEVTFTNRLKPGKISILKVSITGEPLAGAKFLLEWSVDGTNWQPVSYTDSQYVTEGTCTSPSLTDGRLISGADGVVDFTGLHPERLYRLTETAAPDGYQLLADTAYEGDLPADKELTIQLTVVNVPTFELPKTGSKSMAMVPIALALACGFCGALLYISKRKGQ